MVTVAIECYHVEDERWTSIIRLGRYLARARSSRSRIASVTVSIRGIRGSRSRPELTPESILSYFSQYLGLRTEDVQV